MGETADTTINADKYSTNEFYCWLVVDPEIAPNPRALDDEEFIEIVRGVSIQSAMSMLTRGQMSVVSGFVFLLGARKLRQLGMISDDF